MKKKELYLPARAERLKLNAGQNGFYRVRYDARMRSALGDLIKQNKISALDGAGMENDLFSGMLAGQCSLLDYLSFVEKYCLNAGYPLNSGISLHLNWLFQIGCTAPWKADVCRVSLLFHRRLLQKIGWERNKNEPHVQTILRSRTIASLGLLEDAGTLHRAAAIFDHIKAGKESVDSNIRGAIYTLAAWKGNKEVFAYLLERYIKESIPEESRKLLRALGMFQNPVLIKKVLDLSQSTTVRLQDSIIIPLSVSSNPAAKMEQLWQWTTQQWKVLQRKYNSGTHMLPSYVHNFSGITSSKLRQDFKHFFANKDNVRDDIKIAVKQVLEKSEVNIKFLEKN